MNTNSPAQNVSYRPLLMIMVVVAFVSVGNAQAMPPHPDIQGKIERGEIPEPFLKNYFYGVPASLKINAPSQENSPVLTGAFKALCILVDFSDNVSAVNPTDFDTLIYDAGSNTVRHYYSEVSYGQLDIIAVNLPSTMGWKRAPQPYTFYVNDSYGTGSYPQNAQRLCEDLVDMVDSVVDFSQYDNNGDGRADVVMIAHAGPGAEKTGSTGDIWSHKWNIDPRLKDGVYISSYTIMPEYWNTPGDMTIGVYCHELAHAFGLPDLYDTEDPDQGGTASQGIGRWSLMAAGSWNGVNGSSPAHPDAWSKKELGWINPTVISSSQAGVSVPNIENNAVAFRLWKNGEIGDEYYLAANRQQLGYDSYLPYNGLLIWHIDESVTTDNDHEWYPGHTGDGHYLVALEQADGLWELEKNLSPGNGSDPYPGTGSVTSFTPTSTPNSDAYNASGSYVSVTGISASSAVMTADFAVSLASDAGDVTNPVQPQLELKQNYPNPFNPDTRIIYSLDVPGQIDLRVFNILGQFVTRLASGYHGTGVYDVKWNGTDDSGRRVPSGIYFYELTTETKSLVKKMILTK